MMKNLLAIMSVSLLVFVITSCETDIDVNAEYEDITVVYGLVDPNDTTHYVKINKAFLGDGNALDLAANEANFNYDPSELSVVVEQYSPLGTLVSTHGAVATTEIPKDEGTFDNSNNILYKFTATNIDRDNTFKLTVYNASLDKEIIGETKIVKPSVVSNPGTATKFQFWNGDISTGIPLDKTIEVNPGNDVGRIELKLYFNYIEHYTIASGKAPANKSVEMNLGEEKTIPMQWELSGETFFSNIENAVPPYSSIADFSHRELANISMVVSIAGTELSTFMDVEAPSNSVNQEKPNYTNLTNALGIFSSREIILWQSTISGGQVNIQNSTIAYLASMNLGFCFGTGGTATAPCNQL